MSIAVVFPGQGSQSVGMMAAFAAERVVRDTFAGASAVLGYDLWQRAQDGPEASLAVTEYTQPLMLAAGVATWRLWQQRGGALPAFMAGHSLGEYSALVAAGSLDFATAVELVRFRGAAMQAAVPPGHGAMAAILGLADADVEAACAEAAQGQTVAAANYNSPGQVVIAGHAAAVARAIEAAKSRGAKRAVMLPVSVPSHTRLMQPAATQLAAKLAGIALAAPRGVEIYAVDLASHAEPAQMRAALAAQLVAPVRWTATIRDMLAKGVRVIVECGPGKVLTSLNRRIERDRGIAMVAVEDPASLDAAIAAAEGTAPPERASA